MPNIKLPDGKEINFEKEEDELGSQQELQTPTLSG